ncbi:MarR family winged helix-turn-helix transcriptional regulator [Stappia sp. ES.058]|uniref:MarR family winged helix-turn-helix transcriptional regulator n=1 Tax=Stappia sp. ES.058 TaxID=1881061 RepID=UPI0008799336|nr:MarR family transcriptional regulator [Stappia sp. ES.058]SDU45029.1 DNA-binding transcriptional regulator, MarR family [Stappia sp. ES.058]
MIKPPSVSTLPGQGEGKRGPDGYLGYLLRQAANAYRHRVEAVLRDIQLTQPQFAALTMLDTYPHHSSADLARLALLTPQTMSTIIGNLEKAGLINRKPHAVHGRKQQIALTSPGRSLLAEAKKRVYALEAELVDGYSQEEDAIVRRWLVAVATGEPG